jgi:hypothetical protein
MHARWAQDIWKLCSDDQSRADKENCTGEIFVFVCYCCVLTICNALYASYI